MNKNKQKCKALVTDSTGFHPYPCNRPAKYGKYCGVHSPEKRAERKAKRGPTEFEKSMIRHEKMSEIVKQMRAVKEKSEGFLSGINPNLYEDWEEDHVRADSLLCQALIVLGYDYLVDAFNGIAKRYN